MTKHSALLRYQAALERAASANAKVVTLTQIATHGAADEKASAQRALPRARAAAKTASERARELERAYDETPEIPTRRSHHKPLHT